jgi:hypothetical protein
MTTEETPLSPDAYQLVGYLEQLQHNADTASWWRRVRTRNVSDAERCARARRDFRVIVGRVGLSLRGPTVTRMPSLPEAEELVACREFREGVYAAIESTHAGRPWWHTYQTSFATV